MKISNNFNKPISFGELKITPDAVKIISNKPNHLELAEQIHDLAIEMKDDISDVTISTIHGDGRDSYIAVANYPNNKSILKDQGRLSDLKKCVIASKVSNAKFNYSLHDKSTQNYKLGLSVNFAEKVLNKYV